MRAIDSNVLVRLIARDDPAQATAAETFAENGVWVSTLALAEAIWVLSSVYNRSAAEITAIVERLLQQERVSLQDADLVRAALTEFRKRPSLGFSDCLLLESARSAGHLPFGTFDRALAKLPGAERIA